MSILSISLLAFFTVVTVFLLAIGLRRLTGMTQRTALPPPGDQSRRAGGSEVPKS